MGIGAGTLTLAQLATVVGKYSNVIYMNDGTYDNLLYTIEGSPRTLVINLAQFLNIASGEIQGDAIALDELTANQIAAGAVATSELADASVTGVKLDATPSLFENANTTAIQEHSTGGPATLLGANVAGEGDRLVIVQAEVTETFVTTNWEWDVGSGGTLDALFDDIFGSPADLALGETVVGAYLLPEAEALVLTENNMADGTAGIIRFNIVVITPAAGSIPGGLLADDAVGFPYGVSPTLFAWDGIATQVLLTSNSDNDRIVLVTGIASETAVGDPEIDVGAGAGNEVFDDLAAGAWVVGERWVGAMVLPAGSALNVTLTVGAASAGDINFYVKVLTQTVQTAQIQDNAITPDKVQDPITEGVAGVGIKFIMAELAIPDDTIADVDMMASAAVPSGALICGGYIETIDALTETGTNATVGLELPEGADDLLAAVSVDAAPWVGAGRVAVIPTMDDPSTWILTTSTRNVVLTIANGVSESHAVDSGNIRVVLFYIEPKTGAI